MNTLRFEGPICLDLPNSPWVWTVIDANGNAGTTLSREGLLKLGYTDQDLLMSIKVRGESI